MPHAIKHFFLLSTPTISRRGPDSESSDEVIAGNDFRDIISVELKLNR
jgi:hypothetical protein